MSIYTNVRDTLGLIAVVACLYVVTGYFGLFLAIEEFKYATAIWIPAGIALGSVLVWGLRVLPGVFIGSVIINFYISINNHPISLWDSLGIATFIASGTSLQTFFGYYLIKKWVGLNNPLNDPKVILLFALFTGPIACLFSATFNNLFFLWLDLLPAKNFVVTWLTWYVGDTIGSLVFTPVLLILFSKPYQVWHTRIISVLLPLCISFAIYTLIYIIARSNYNAVSQVWFVLTFNLLFCVLITVTTFIISGQKNLIQSKMNEILCSVGEGIYVVNNNGVFTFINPALEKMWGYKQSELIGKNIHDVLHPTHSCQAQNSKNATCPIFDAMLNKSVIHTTDELYVRQDGSHFWMEYTCSPLIIDEKRVGAVVIVNNVDMRRKAAAELEKLAHYDSLTNLPNRTTFFLKLSEAINNFVVDKNKLLAVCFLDLDNFKQINDNLGHNIGDETLNTISQILREHLRTTDYIARLGGDEFAIILEDIYSEEKIALLLDELIENVSKPLKINQYEIHISMSIGVALYPQAGKNGEDLLKNADIAMYHAKASGKRQYAFFDDLMTKSVKRLHQIDLKIRHALQKNELTLLYQFQIDNSTNAIFGVEALLRWNNQSLGEVSPSEFIPIIEKNGLIHEIGEWVIRNACKDAVKIQKILKRAISLSVNVSVIQFENDEFVEQLKNLIKQTTISPSLIFLEITESALMKNPSNTIEIMNAIKKLGINFALDDFGVNYSSMQYLKTLPISQLKIDASFVRDIVNNPNGIAIIKAIIQLARDLSISTVAEGVETFAQLSLLKEMNCNYSQGFYFSKPMSFEEIVNMSKESILT